MTRCQGIILTKCQLFILTGRWDNIINKVMEQKNTSNIWTQIEALSRHLNVPRPTFLQWRHRGYVPPSRHHDLVSAAELHDLTSEITSKALHGQWLENSVNGRKFAGKI
jgi:hypothetical protein